MSTSNVVQRDPAIRVMLLPKDTNGYGTIFGGAILSHLDLAGAIEAGKHGACRMVTVAMNRVAFIAPVFVGDVVSFYAETTRVGNTSVTVFIEVEAGRADGSDMIKVAEAEVVYVAVDEGGKPISIGGVKV
ncbi:MAG: acyl-CoA thioesterase [Candidatus Latescibacteria bacterium]|jgi:acyl-CoA thioesterase YciA|nr:acyl-CoA thioesterase [Candidatus Latescibacterota bacterium]MBT4139679.1 acyl-CoA thioesterase [Candidatus Latescibacterota bacterium]MBT5831785.1 acyl-CoA thioesterase [Candidatus Latescibacterota bacterium]